jgi:putative ABC transport system ATP-binding protein
LAAEALVHLENVHKTYLLGQVEIKALRGLDLNIYRGDFTALIGSSGSGKSTILNLIGGLDRPTSGHVWIEKEKMDTLSDRKKSILRNQKIGFIFQSFNLIPVLSVYENIELPLHLRHELTEADRRSRIEGALDDVGLLSFAKQMPDKLSGGQRQRVAIARALVTDPLLILADEPTASLDSENAHKIIDLLINLNVKKKVTFLFCSHDEKLINRVPRILRIQDGIVSEQEAGRK